MVHCPRYNHGQSNHDGRSNDDCALRTQGERVLIVEDDPATRLGWPSWSRPGASRPTRRPTARRRSARSPPSVRRSSSATSSCRAWAASSCSRALKDQLSDITFILLTAQGTVESAVEAIKEGAYDYLSKPVDPQRLQILLQKAVERQETLREVQAAAPPAARAGQLRPDRRQQPGHPTRLSRHRAGGADRRVGADLGRVGHGQGAGGADRSTS